MEEGTSLVRVVSQPTEATFQQEKRQWTVRWLLLSTLVIFALETILMLILEYFLDIHQFVVWGLDGLILVLVLLPLNYYYVVRPLAHQVEAHRKTNQELVKTNEILGRFFSISDILIAYMDANFNFIRVNEAYANTDQRLPEEFIGKNHFALFPNEENRAIFEKVVRTGESYVALEKPFEYAGHPERGITYWDWSLLPVKDPQGHVIGLILALTNVTARKQAQMALGESERRFRAVFNQTFQHSALLDPQGQVQIANQTALEFTGLSQAEISGLPLWQVPWWDNATALSGEPVQILQDAVQQAVAGSIVRCELRVRSVESETAIMDITIKPLLDEDGHTHILIYEARDITERFRSDEALKRSEAQINRLYQAEMKAHQFAETLRSAILALSGSLHGDTVLEILLDHLYKVVPYTSAHIILLEDEEHLVVRLARGEVAWDSTLRLLGKRYEIGEMTFFQPLLTQCRVMSAPDALLYPGPFFLPTDVHIRSWLGMPLQAGDQVIGMCLLEHECPGFFTQELADWATTLTSHAAVAIQNAWLFEQVRDGREHLQALSRRLVEAQEHERYFIARELHDEAGQALASLKFSLHLLEVNSGDPEKVLSLSQDLKDITDQVMEELHRLSVDLRPAVLDHLGLVSALRQHVESIGSQHELSIQFDTIGKIGRLPGEMETAIYRIVQESLTNIVRHAKAERVSILLKQDNEQLLVVVEDDGIGFNPDIPKVGQLGVLGIRERADMLGGKVIIESAPGIGTTILLEVPWPSVS